MKLSKHLVFVAMAAVALGLVSAGVGLFYRTGGAVGAFTNIYGDNVELYGDGLYRNDPVFSASAYIGTDAITFFIAAPLTQLALGLAGKGSLRGRVLLAGMLVYFLYTAIHMAFTAMYNLLFPVYILYLSASFFAFVLAITSIDRGELAALISDRLPRRGLAALCILAGVVVLFVWGLDVVTAIFAGRPPAIIGPYTTMVTHAVDMGIIAPTAFVAATGVLRRTPLGYLLATVCMVLLSSIGLAIIGQTVVQLSSGVVFTLAQYVIYIGSFLALSAAAVWQVVGIFKGLKPVG